MNWPTISFPLNFDRKSVHVVRIRLDRPPEYWQPLTRFLSADEKSRADRYRFDEPRRQFVICRATLRCLLGHSCGIAPQSVTFAYGSHGKPELSATLTSPLASRIEFSVSHSGAIGLIAVTTGKSVGIDVEELNPAVKLLSLADRFFANSEADELKRLPPEQQLAGFYRGWTCKEAYIKAKGCGLSHPLSSFQVGMDPVRPASLHQIQGDPDGPSRWTIMSLNMEAEYAAAVMVEEPGCLFLCWDWPTESMPTP